MSVDKLVDSTQLDADLTSVANAIRTKGGTSASLAFPADFVSAIAAIPTGGGGVSWDDIASGDEPSGDIVLTVQTVKQDSFRSRRTTNTWTCSGNNVTKVESAAFRDCNNLTELHLPAVTDFSYQTCYGSSKLKVADIGRAGSLGNGTFQNCTLLDTLVLRKTSITTMGNANALSGTKFASGKSGGTIYIPKSLYDHLGDNSSSDYKAASNWATYQGYGTITWAKIEGSIYE